MSSHHGHALQGHQQGLKKTETQKKTGQAWMVSEGCNTMNRQFTLNGCMDLPEDGRMHALTSDRAPWQKQPQAASGFGDDCC